MKRRSNTIPWVQRKVKRTATGKGLTSASVKQLVKRSVLNTAESKHCCRGELNLQLYHSGGLTSPGYVYNNILYSTNGTGDNPAPAGSKYDTRIGDEIYLQKLEIKYWLSNKDDRPNVMYRILVYKYEVTTTPGLTDILGSIGNQMIEFPNTGNITVLRDMIVNERGSDFSIETGSVKKEISFYRKMDISFNNTKVVYRSGSTNPKNWDIGMMVVAYDAYGTPKTDNIASFGWNYRLTFKDP